MTNRHLPILQLEKVFLVSTLWFGKAGNSNQKSHDLNAWKGEGTKQKCLSEPETTNQKCAKNLEQPITRDMQII